MKLVFLDKENMLLFLNMIQKHQLNFEKKEILEKQLKEILTKLKQIFHTTFYGYYTSYVYQDHVYGTILKIHREDLDDFDYFRDEIELCLQIEKSSKILYQIEDPMMIYKGWHRKTKLYYYQQKFYLEIVKIMNQQELGKFLEFVIPVFQNTKEIITCGRELKGW